MDRDTLTRGLRERAREQGFDACGVAAARRLERDGAALETWLARRHHSGMKWMARAAGRRADPRELLPGCRSVAVFAMSYWPGDAESRPGPEGGRVALYARGRDYHKVLSRRLRSIVRWLDGAMGSSSRAFVDTGPVLERAWAERAGLGWIAKNANLLTRELGSWLLLGEVLTTASLEPDPGPRPGHCGTCTACIDACPTGAIVGEGVVDAGLCIAYWTIEHRGGIPRERRAGIGEWIFGCDVCQEVCPWNRKAGLPRESDAFARRDDLRGLDPAAVVAMDEAAFRSRFSGTSLMRARWDGMRRNACVVLGNRRRETDLEVLARALGDDDPVVAGHAAWAVGEIGGRRARALLDERAGRESRTRVLEEIRAGLEQSAAPGAAD